MSRDTLTGSRIRERRIMAGLRQAELARRVDVSASYLNLIEHNRRRIGGKLLLAIADVLDVEPSMLTEGAQATLISTLREAASDRPEAGAELARADEFAGRFPGWAELLADSRRRIDTLERTVTTLTDRLTHDPHLAASLHDMLTTVTAIRSTASILAESGEIEREWQDRFHRNINEDSARLAEASQALVRYLDAAEDATADMRAPQEEIDAVLARNRYWFPAIEAGEAAPAEVVEAEAGDISVVARKLLLSMLKILANDVARVSRAEVLEGLRQEGPNPFVLAERWKVDPVLAMRRIAVLAPQAGLPAIGMAACDASGALIYRQPLDAFPLPRFGAGCPMLPLYQALCRPMLPVMEWVQTPARLEQRFRAYAFASPAGPWRANRTPLLQAYMIVIPESGSDSGPDPLGVGVSCRICPRETCPGRREPSILSGGL